MSEWQIKTGKTPTLEGKTMGEWLENKNFCNKELNEELARRIDALTEHCDKLSSENIDLWGEIKHLKDDSKQRRLLFWKLERRVKECEPKPAPGVYVKPGDLVRDGGVCDVVVRARSPRESFNIRAIKVWVADDVGVIRPGECLLGDLTFNGQPVLGYEGEAR